MTRFALAALLALTLTVSALAAPVGALQPADLRCEMLREPLGIDVAQPRLSWVSECTVPGRRGLVQTAYQVLVASSPAALAAGRGDLWDSGKVPGNQSTQLPYAGDPLRSFQPCWWQVRVWDNAGRPSAWSAPASWSMGILDPAGWQAKWLSYTRPEAPATDASAQPREFADARWIWFPEGDPHREIAAGTRCFRRAFDLPAGAKVTAATFLLTVDDQFTLFINGTRVAVSDGTGYAWQRPQLVDLAPHLRPGRNVLAVEAANTAVSPAAFIGRLVVAFADAPPLTLTTDRDWRVTDAATPGWEQPDFADSGWLAPVDLGEMGTAPWGAIRLNGEAAWSDTAPAPLFRKTFAINRPLRRATVYLCGLGFYEIRLNGAKVGDRVLDPVFTRYDKRALYATYDLTASLRRGRNTLGVMLGNGWYNQFSRDAWSFEQAPWRDRPRMLLHLRLEYADGSVRNIVSDGSWRAAAGPVVRNGVRNGEVYDARRRELPGWDTPAFDATTWDRPDIVAAPAGVLRAEMMPPVRVMHTLTPVAVTEPKPGLYVFDMGQAFAGWAQLHVSGPAGTQVTLRYGERLRDDGTVQRDQIQTLVYEGPFQTDQYILRGTAEEVFEPHFTYHGFRWVEVEGLPAKPTAQTVLGRVAHTSFEPAGNFECSNPLLNAIQRCTLWSYRSNYLGYPTDCPQREKNGWTGDAQLATEQGLYNWDNAASYEKWMNDFADEQPANGELPGIVPTSGWGYGVGPAWDSAYVLIPWYLYIYQGDERVLAEHYAGMKRYVDYLTTRQHDHIVDYGLGDWVPAKTDTPVGVTSTGYYYIDALTVARAARLLGKPDDAARYEQLAADIRAAFNKTFYHGAGSYANDSQTALSCALFQGLAEESEIPATVQRLVANVEAQDGHLDTGILGAKYLFNTLTDNGRVDVAYRIATQTTPPSYGNWIKRGATTLWEDWPGAGSLNHIMFGDISAWFYKTLAGINLDPAQPGFRHTIIHPRPTGDLTWARAEHQTPYGKVTSAWQLRNGSLTLDVTIPPNTTATIYVPATDAATVTESGRPAAKAPGVRPAGTRDGCALFTVGSGTYAFRATGRKP